MNIIICVLLSAIVHAQNIEYFPYVQPDLLIIEDKMFFTASIPETEPVHFNFSSRYSGIPLTINPCCTASQSPAIDGCTNPSLLSGICINEDGEHVYELKQNYASVTSVYSFNVSNPKTCNGIAIAVKSLIGISQFAVNFGKNAISAMGSFPLVQGCAEINQLIETVYFGTWDGTVTVTVTSMLKNITVNNDRKVKFSIVISETNNLALPYFNKLAEIEYRDVNYNKFITGDNCKSGYRNLLVPITEKYCDLDFDPTKDPIYDRFNRAFNTIELPQQSFFTWSLTLRRYDESKTRIEKVYFNQNLLTNATISILNLYKSDNTPYNPVFTVKAKQLTCDYTRFVAKYNEFNNRNTFLTSPYTVDDVRVDLRFSGSLAPALSMDWIACEQRIYNDFYVKSEGYTQVYDTNCYAAYGTDDFNNDPCCNLTLASTMCCKERNVNLVKEKLLVNVDTIKDKCLRPQCASSIGESLIPYLNPKLSDTKKRCGQIEEYKKLLINRNRYDLYTCIFEVSNLRNCFLNEHCQAIYGPDARCRAEPYNDINEFVCMIPCNNDSDCLSGICKWVGGYKTCTSKYNSQSVYWYSPEAKKDHLSCIVKQTNRLDPWLQYNIKRKIGVNLNNVSDTEMYDKWNDLASTQGCSVSYGSLAFYNYPSSFRNKTSQQFCNQAQKCRHKTCHNDILGFCSEPYCSNTYGPSNTNYYCGRCFEPGNNDSSCARVSQWGECFIFPTAYAGSTFTSYCKSINGYYDPLYPGCWDQRSMTESECVPDRLCPNPYKVTNHRFLSENTDGFRLRDGTGCYPVCYWEEANQQTCESMGFTWSVHQKDGIVYQMCHLPAYFVEQCMAYNTSSNGTINAKWFYGVNYFPPKRNSSATCTDFCLYNESLAEPECKSQYHCENPLCRGCNEQDCLKSGYCGIGPGCYIGHDVYGDCNLDAAISTKYSISRIMWTQVGCQVGTSSFRNSMNKVTCQQLAKEYGRSYFFLYPEEWASLTEEQCKGLDQTCKGNFDIIPSSWQLYLVSQYSIFDLTHKNQDECAACDGQIKSISWFPGQWVPSDDQWVELDWIKSGMIPISNWTDVVDEDYVNAIYNTASAQREAEILSASLSCYFGYKSSLIKDMTCLCGGTDGSCYTEAASLSHILSTTRACSLVPINYTFPEFGELSITNNFAIADLGCLSIEVYNFPKVSFSFLERVSLTASIPSNQNDRSKIQYIKNDNLVIVGTIIGNGVGFKFINTTQKSNIKGVSVCIVFPTSMDLTLNGLSLTILDIGETPFVDIDKLDDIKVKLLNLPLGTTKACINITEDIILFPVALVQNYDKVTYQSTFKEETLIIIYIGYAIYTILFVLSAFLLFQTGRRVYRLRNDQNFLLFLHSSLVICVFMVLYTIARIMLLSFLVNGRYVDNKILIVILFELPTLLQLSSVASIVYNWSLIYSKSKMRDIKMLRYTVLKRLLIIFLACLLALLIIIVIINGTSSNNNFRIITCFEQNVELSVSENVAIAYFSIVIFLVLMLLFATVFFSYVLLSSVTKFGSSKAKYKTKKEDPIFNLLFVSVSSITLLLGSTLYLVKRVTPWDKDWSPFANVSYLLIIDTLSVSCFLYFIYFTSYNIMKNYTEQKSGGSNVKMSSDMSSKGIRDN